MLARERLLNLLNGRPVEGLAWNALVDETTLAGMPAEIRPCNGTDFCRMVGADVIQLGDFFLPPEAQAGDPFTTCIPGVENEEFTTDAGVQVRRSHTPWGILTATFRQGHPLEYPVKDLADLHILRHIWEMTHYEEIGPEWEQRHARAEKFIGDDGIYTHFIPSSPVQRLLEYDMGLANFYAFFQDTPADMESLLEVMQARWLESVEILARRTPAQVIIPVENTSTTMISPAFYNKYSQPQIEAFVQCVHAHGKKAVIHMCGWLKNLLPALKATGLDGIHALTPPTIGDTPFALALNTLGETVTLMGLLDGTVFHDPNVTTQDIRVLLDRVYTPQLRASNFILIVAADGLPTPLWKFQAVQEWMQVNGGRC